MSNSKSILYQLLVIVLFFFVWVDLVESKGLGDSDLSIVLGLLLPFTLLLFVTYYKSKIAYGLILFIFSLSIVVALADLWSIYFDPYKEENNFYGNGMSFVRGYSSCLQAISYSTMAFGLMSSKELRNTYTWRISDSKNVLFFAICLNIIFTIFFQYLYW